MTAPISNGPTTTRLHHYAGHYCTSAQSPAPRRVPNPVVTASAPGQVWAIDVQFDSDRKGSVFKTCHAIDAFTRQHPPFRVKRPMGAADVIDMLGWLSLPMGTPGAARR